MNFCKGQFFKVIVWIYFEFSLLEQQENMTILSKIYFACIKIQDFCGKFYFTVLSQIWPIFTKIVKICEYIFYLLKLESNMIYLR